MRFYKKICDIYHMHFIAGVIYHLFLNYYNLFFLILTHAIETIIHIFIIC